MYRFQSAHGRRVCNADKLRAGFSHPNIVRIHDWAMNERVFCVVVDLLEGQSISARMEELDEQQGERLHCKYMMLFGEFALYLVENLTRVS